MKCSNPECGRLLTVEEIDSAEAITETDAQCFACLDRKEPDEYDRVTWTDWLAVVLISGSIAAYVVWRLW